MSDYGEEVIAEGPWILVRGCRKRVWCDGPLARYALGYGVLLVERGYAPSGVEGQLRLMAHVSRWLAEQREELAALTPDAVERFLVSSSASRRAVGPLLSYLGGLGLVPEPPVLDTPAERLLAEYRDYLVHERGLVAGSVDVRERVARLFLAVQSERLSWRCRGCGRVM